MDTIPTKISLKKFFYNGTVSKKTCLLYQSYQFKANPSSIAASYITKRQEVVRELGQTALNEKLVDFFSIYKVLLPSDFLSAGCRNKSGNKNDNSSNVLVE